MDEYWSSPEYAKLYAKNIKYTNSGIRILLKIREIPQILEMRKLCEICRIRKICEKRRICEIR